MIKNKLTKIEFNKILYSIFCLKDIDTIRKTIFELLYYKPPIPDGESTPTINLETTGIYSTYKGFEIEISTLIEFGIVIRFKKDKAFFDGVLYHPPSLISNHIIRYFEKKYYRDCFVTSNVPYYTQYNLLKYQIFHLKDTLNSNWYKQKKLSPIMLIEEERVNKYEIQFQINLQCFEHVNNRFTLKDNWEELCWHFAKKFT